MRLPEIEIACVATGLVTRYMSGSLVAYPDLQAGEGGAVLGGGGSHLDPELRRGPGVKKKKFRPFGPQFGLKIEGGGKGGWGRGGSLDPPLHLDGLRRRLYEITFCESFV